MISKLVVHTVHSGGSPVVSFHAENNDMITASSVAGNTYTFENINSNKVYVYADQALREDQKVQKEKKGRKDQKVQSDRDRRRKKRSRSRAPGLTRPHLPST